MGQSRSTGPLHLPLEDPQRLNEAWLLRIPTCEKIFNHRKAVAASPAAEKETTGGQKTVAGVKDKGSLHGEVALSPVAISAIIFQHVLDGIAAARAETVARGVAPGRLAGFVVKVCRPEYTDRTKPIIDRRTPSIIGDTRPR